MSEYGNKILPLLIPTPTISPQTIHLLNHRADVGAIWRIH